MSATTQARSRAGRGLAHRLRGRGAALTFVVSLLFLFFALNAENFTDSRNIYEILRTSAFTIMIGLPLTYLLIVGEFDLSAGPAYGFAAVVTGLAISDWGWNPWVAVVVVMLIGAFIGSINALVTVGFGVPSFISTLGMSSVVGGLALVLTGGLPVVLPDSVEGTFFASVSGGEVAGVPVQVLWAAGAFAIFGFVLRYTVFGAHAYATGGNRLAAVRLGVKANRVKAACFMLVGLSCGLAGALTTGWLQSASPSTGQASTLDFYAAVIIGGAAVDGGAGTATGTVLGALIISMLKSGLVLLGVQGSWVQFFAGLLIILVGVSELLSRPQASPVAQQLRLAGWRVRGALGGRRADASAEPPDGGAARDRAPADPPSPAEPAREEPAGDQDEAHVNKGEL